MDTRLDTVIIGGGQAGLALGYYLQRAGRRFTILEAADRLGNSWRRRWDSLTLFTPRREDALPGMPFPGRSRGFPGKDEVADYLEAYAYRFHLPVELGSPVMSVRHDLSDGFAVETGILELSTRQVVVATGFSEPIEPRFASRLDPRVHQLHSDRYRNPASVPEGRIVVAGGERTAVEIAEELARAGRYVSLSVPSIGTALGERSGRVKRVGRVVDADGDQLVLVTGDRLDADAVVWATGYRPHYPWLHLPVLDEFGAPIHHHGITDVPGLAFLGLPGQRTRASALLGGVSRDAALLADVLGRQLAAPSRTRSSRAVEGRPSRTIAPRAARASGDDRHSVPVWLKRTASGPVVYLAEQYLPDAFRGARPAQGGRPVSGRPRPTCCWRILHL